MSFLFDDIARTLAAPMPRRKALTLIGGIILGAFTAQMAVAACSGCTASQCCNGSTCASTCGALNYCNAGNCANCTGSKVICGSVPNQSCCSANCCNTTTGQCCSTCPCVA